MKRTLWSLIPLIPLALAACASAPPGTKESVAQAPADKDVICERETRTGSNLPTTVCRTAAEREAARKAVDSMAESARNIRAGQTGKPGS